MSLKSRNDNNYGEMIDIFWEMNDIRREMNDKFKAASPRTVKRQSILS